MTRTNTIYACMIAITTFTLTSVNADPPKEPYPFGVDPYDWECAYPYSETNCARVIRFWARDCLDDPANVSNDVVPCEGCEAIKVTDWSGNEWPTHYRCIQPLGYEVVAEDLSVKLSFYRKGDSKNGWKVLDWAMYECVRTWQCFEMCAFDRGEPACLVSSVISIGLFQPVLGKPCDQRLSGEGQGVDSPDLKPFSSGS